MSARAPESLKASGRCFRAERGGFAKRRALASGQSLGEGGKKRRMMKLGHAQGGEPIRIQKQRVCAQAQQNSSAGHGADQGAAMQSALAELIRGVDCKPQGKQKLSESEVRVVDAGVQKSAAIEESQGGDGALAKHVGDGLEHAKKSQIKRPIEASRVMGGGVGGRHEKSKGRRGSKTGAGARGGRARRGDRIEGHPLLKRKKKSAGGLDPRMIRVQKLVIVKSIKVGSGGRKPGGRATGEDRPAPIKDGRRQRGGRQGAEQVARGFERKRGISGAQNPRGLKMVRRQMKRSDDADHGQTERAHDRQRGERGQPQRLGGRAGQGQSGRSAQSPQSEAAPKKKAARHGERLEGGGLVGASRKKQSASARLVGKKKKRAEPFGQRAGAGEMARLSFGEIRIDRVARIILKNGIQIAQPRADKERIGQAGGQKSLRVAQIESEKGGGHRRVAKPLPLIKMRLPMESVIMKIEG